MTAAHILFAHPLQAIGRMDHLEILLAQHHSILRNLQGAAATDLASDRSRLLEEGRAEIELHTYLEEAYVYPVLESFDSMRAEVSGFWREHEQLRAALQAAISDQREEAMFQARMSALVAMLEEHAREEEHHLFPEARRILPDDQLDKMEREIRTALWERGLAA